MTDFFIKQTAFDYDMEFQDVKKIAEQFPNDYDNFYKELENFILQRSKNKLAQVTKN